MILSTLLLAAARGALVLGAALAAMPLLRRASAAARRLVLVGAFGAVLVLPLVSALLPAVRVALPAFAAQQSNVAVEPAPDSVAHAVAIDGPSIASSPAPRPVAPPSSSSLPSPSTLLVVIWGAGALVVAARLTNGLLRARALARGASLVAKERLGARDVEVRVSAAIETPAVTGLFTPVVLLPRDALAWSDERRHVVLLHELAHVAQRDCLATFVAQLACALHWFNPLAWLAARRFRVERELAADDRVLGAGARASTYAEHLLAIATAHADVRAVPSGALAMAQRSSLEERVVALLAPARARAPLGRARLAVLGACGAALVGAVACATPDRSIAPAAGPSDASSTKASGLERRGGASLESIPRAELTLDATLQAIAEEETDRMAAEWKTRTAVVIVLDPATGAVLAMTSRSSGAHAEIGAQHAFYPGSTMKPFVVAAALEEGAIKPDQRFDCENGTRSYGSEVFHDHAPHGWLDVGGILAVSSNIGMSKIYDELGGAKLVAWTKRFHFGEAPSLPLPFVASGSVPSSLDDKSLRGAITAIGEGITATPIQLAAAFAAIANGGVYHPPALVRRAQAGERVLREETARTVMTMLEAVVTSDRGTGFAARVAGVRVAGKTGTADQNPGGPEEDFTYASFVGAAPSDHPRYVILVGAEAAGKDAWGGKLAAPVFSRIMTRALTR